MDRMIITLYAGIYVRLRRESMRGSLCDKKIFLAGRLRFTNEQSMHEKEREKRVRRKRGRRRSDCINNFKAYCNMITYIFQFSKD